MPGESSLRAIPRMRETSPDTQIVVLRMHNDAAFAPKGSAYQPPEGWRGSAFLSTTLRNLNAIAVPFHRARAHGTSRPLNGQEPQLHCWRLCRPDETTREVINETMAASSSAGADKSARTTTVLHGQPFPGPWSTIESARTSRPPIVGAADGRNEAFRSLPAKDSAGSSSSMARLAFAASACRSAGGRALALALALCLRERQRLGGSSSLLVLVVQSGAADRRGRCAARSEWRWLLSR